MSSTSTSVLPSSLPERIQPPSDKVMNHSPKNTSPNVTNTTTTQRLIEKATLQAKLAIQLDQDDDVLGAAQAYHLTCLTLRQALHLVSQQDYPALVQVYRAHSKRLLYLQGVLQKRKNPGSASSPKNLQWGRSLSSTPDLRSTLQRESEQQTKAPTKTKNEEQNTQTSNPIPAKAQELASSPKSQPLNSPTKMKLQPNPHASELPDALNPIVSPTSKKYTISNRNRSESFATPSLESIQRPTHTLTKKHSSPALNSYPPTNTSQFPIINHKPGSYQYSVSKPTTSTTSLPSLSNSPNPLTSPVAPRTLRSKTASHLPKLVLHSSYNNLHSLYNQGSEIYSPKTPLPPSTDSNRLMFQSIWNEEMESKQSYHPPPNPNHPIYPLLILQRVKETMTTGGYVLTRKFYLTPLTWSHPNIKFSNLNPKEDGLDLATQHLNKLKDLTQSNNPNQICRELDNLETILHDLCIDMSKKVPEVNLAKLAPTPTGSGNRKLSSTPSNNTATQALLKMASKITKSVEKVQNQFKITEQSPNQNYLEKLFKFLVSIQFLIDIFDEFGDHQMIQPKLAKIVKLVHVGFFNFILADCSRAIARFLSPGRPLALD